MLTDYALEFIAKLTYIEFNGFLKVDTIFIVEKFRLYDFAKHVML